LLMKTYVGLLIVAVSALIVASACADGTTAQAAAQMPATNGQSATVRIGEGRIPRELAEKLTGDQIVELLKLQPRHFLAPAIISIPLLFVVAVITLGLSFQHRRIAMLHRTLAAMIEKGVPIPPELLKMSEPVKPKHSNLHRGLVACGAGLGLMLFLAVFRETSSEQGLWAVGFIPLFIGIGLLIVWKLEQRKPNS